MSALVAAQALRQFMDQRAAEHMVLREALSILERGAAAPAPPSGAQDSVAQKTPKVQKTQKTVKASKTTKSGKGKAASESADEPRRVKGHMPRVGVEQVVCESLKDRQTRVGILKENGYTRVGQGEPLSAGCYDVRSTGDGDESCVVIWRPKAEEAA